MTASCWSPQAIDQTNQQYNAAQMSNVWGSLNGARQTQYEPRKQELRFQRDSRALPEPTCRKSLKIPDFHLVPEATQVSRVKMFEQFEDGIPNFVKTGPDFFHSFARFKPFGGNVLVDPRYAGELTKGGSSTYRELC